MRERKTLGAIFLMPAILAVITAAGLMFALLGDGIWDATSWLALSVPIFVAAWFVWLHPRRRS